MGSDIQFKYGCYYIVLPFITELMFVTYITYFLVNLTCMLLISWGGLFVFLYLNNTEPSVCFSLTVAPSDPTGSALREKRPPVRRKYTNVDKKGISN